MTRNFTFWLLLTTVLRVSAVLADSPDSSKVASPPENNGIVLGGLMDLYYGYNFNNPKANTFPIAGSATLPPSQNGPFRNFDLYHNQFGVNAVELSVSKKGKEIGFKADLDFGETTDTIHLASGANGGTDQVTNHIGQAYLTYSPTGLSDLSITVGKTYTHMGLETTKSKDNWQYSRSFLYAIAIPYWHTGASASYAWVPGKLSTNVYIYNGWNTLYSNSGGKDLGFQAGWTPSEGISVYYNLITGPGGPSNNDRPIVHDLNSTVNLTSNWSVAVDLAAGSVNSALSSAGNLDHSWYAMTVATKYVLNPKYYISPRVELYRDGDGYTTSGTGQNLTGITVTNGFTLNEGFETRLEGRWDHSTARIFPTQDAPNDSQVTGTLAFLYSF